MSVSVCLSARVRLCVCVSVRDRLIPCGRLQLLSAFERALK